MDSPWYSELSEGVRLYVKLLGAGSSPFSISISWQDCNLIPGSHISQKGTTLVQSSAAAGTLRANVQLRQQYQQLDMSLYICM